MVADTFIITNSLTTHSLLYNLYIKSIFGVNIHFLSPSTSPPSRIVEFGFWLQSLYSIYHWALKVHCLEQLLVSHNSMWLLTSYNLCTFFIAFPLPPGTFCVLIFYFSPHSKNHNFFFFFFHQYSCMRAKFYFLRDKFYF